MIHRKIFDGFSALRAIRFQEPRINVLCLEHRDLIFTDSGCGGNHFRDEAPEDRRTRDAVSGTRAALELIVRANWQPIDVSVPTSVCSRSGVRAVNNNCRNDNTENHGHYDRGDLADSAPPCEIVMRNWIPAIAQKRARIIGPGGHKNTHKNLEFYRAGRRAGKSK
jgi:hypothetical protein